MKKLLLALVFVLAVQPAYAACGKHVFIFDAYWCGFCKATKNFLNQRGIVYQSVETTNNRHYQNILTTNFGTGGVPVVIIDGRWNDTRLIGGTVIVGYNEAKLREALCIYN